MSVDVIVKDSKGNGNKLEIDKFHSAAVHETIPELPPKGTKNRRQFFRHSFEAMIVDGSINPVKFTLSSNEKFDIYIRKVVLVIGDSKVSEDKYGNLAALLNGVDLITEESGNLTYIMEKAKTWGEVVYQTGAENADVKIKSTGGEIVAIPIKLFEAIEGGIRLGRDSRDNLTFVVNDALAGLTDHKLFITGYKHLE